MRKSMRLLVVGDEEVGKSSFIHTIYSQVGTSSEKTLKKVILPPEMCLYSKQIFTQLVDTSADMELTPDILACDLVLLLYDISNRETIERIQTEWLPRICAVNPKVPIILVGNKMDKKQLEPNTSIEYVKLKDILKKVVKKFRNVQMGIECSALYDQNVKSVLNCAQRAVLYPLSPLYNLKEKKISINFQKALTRIFRILDHNFGGKLRDSDMNALQERVFQRQLNQQDIKAIKQIILRELEVEQNDCIDLKGFIALQKKCIQMLKIQICWSILRYFNYDDELLLRLNYKQFNIDYLSGESVQLSSQAVDFLIKIYNFAHKNLGHIENASGITKKLIQFIFQPYPRELFLQFKQPYEMTKQKFLAIWSLYAFVNPIACYENILYLGSELSLDQIFVRKTKITYSDFQKIKNNNVFSVLIIDAERAYLGPLFSQGQKIIETDSNGNTYQINRTSYFYSNQNNSKIFVLFKVKKENLAQFFSKNNKNPILFSHSIDLVVEFDQNVDKINRNVIPPHILYRMVARDEAINILNINEPPRLDLSKFPVQYDEGAYTPFFSQIVLKAFESIQNGLQKQKLEQLKLLNRQNDRIKILKFFSIAVPTLFGAYFVTKFIRQRKF